MTLCNACGLRNAKRRSSGAVRQKPPQPQLPQPPLQAQAQTPQQTPGYPQLAVPLQAPAMAHHQAPPMPPHNPAQLQQALPPQPYGHFFYNAHAPAGYPPPAYPGMLLPTKAPQTQPFSKPMAAAEYPPGPMATPGLALPDGMGSPQHHVTLAA